MYVAVQFPCMQILGQCSLFKRRILNVGMGSQVPPFFMERLWQQYIADTQGREKNFAECSHINNPLRVHRVKGCYRRPGVTVFTVVVILNDIRRCFRGRSESGLHGGLPGVSLREETDVTVLHRRPRHCF